MEICLRKIEKSKYKDSNIKKIGRQVDSEFLRKSTKLNLLKQYFMQSI